MDTVQRDTITYPHGPSFLRGNNSIHDSTNSKEKKMNKNMKNFSAKSQLGDISPYQLHSLKLKVGQK